MLKGKGNLDEHFKHFTYIHTSADLIEILPKFYRKPDIGVQTKMYLIRWLGFQQNKS